MKNKAFLWLFPLALLLAITPFSQKIDLALSSYFYTPGNPGHFSNSPFLTMVFNWWAYPALGLAFSSLFIFSASFFFKELVFLQRPSLYLVLVCAVGAGLVSHAFFKEYWGRPRPKQIIQFGGNQTYRPFYMPRMTKEPAKSFVCGHCTMGFYYLALIRLGERLKKKWLKRTGFFLTLFFGFFLCLARIAQGGHYFTDLYASFLVMWWTALLFEPVVGHERTD